MAKNQMKASDLKRYLNTLSKDELVNELAVLFGKLDAVRDYYQAQLDPAGEDQVVAKYKAIIEKEFFPARGFGKLNLSVAKKAIADCRKLCRNPSSHIDAMLFYVEQGVQFINSYGDIKESFYVSGETVYEPASNGFYPEFVLKKYELISTNPAPILRSQYSDRARAAIGRTQIEKPE